MKIFHFLLKIGNLLASFVTTVDGNQKSGVHSPVEVGSLSHYLPGVVHPKWLAGFLPSTVPLGSFFFFDLLNFGLPIGINGYAQLDVTQIVMSTFHIILASEHLRRKKW